MTERRPKPLHPLVVALLALGGCQLAFIVLAGMGEIGPKELGISVAVTGLVVGTATWRATRARRRWAAP